MKRLFTLLGLLLFLPFQAAAEIIVEDAWVRLPPPVADTAAGYMTLRNNGDQDVEITGIQTDMAEHPEFHAMSMHDGMMHMQKMEKVIVPAHGGISFDPGGNHLMLIGLTGPLEVGAHIMMSLRTANGESIMVHAQVRDMRHEHGHSDHHSHEEQHDHHGMH